MIEWLVSAQTWLYGGLSKAMAVAAGPAGVPTLILTAFLFGSLHALMPGHGKSILVSYHLGHSSRVIDGIVSAAILAVMHIGLAVLLVLAGIRLVSASLADAGRVPALQVLSALFVMSTGGYLLFRALRAHGHSIPKDGRTLAMAAGLVPCPLTTFILTYASVHDRLAIGFAAVLAMLSGVLVTLISVALSAVLLRGSILAMLKRNDQFTHRLGFWLEVASAAIVLLLGTLLLRDALVLRWQF